MNDQTPVLEGEELTRLWKSGSKCWNGWVKEHLDYRVIFSGDNFRGYTDKKFSGLIFPNGGIIFDRVGFGQGQFLFDNVNIENSPIEFSNCTWGKGKISFYKTEFNNNISFRNCNFGPGEFSFKDSKIKAKSVDFSNTVFGKGKKSFEGFIVSSDEFLMDNSIFDDGELNFSGSRINSKLVKFDNSVLGNGNIYFADAEFNSDTVSFSNVKFGEGNIYFNRSHFINSDIDFSDSIINSGSIVFSQTHFSSNYIDFKRSRFGGPFVFSNCENTKSISGIAFDACRFEGVLDLRGDFHCVPDLRRTVFVNHLDLQNLNIYLKCIDYNNDTLSSLRRLKELSESSKNHEAALRYHADERRVLRKTHLDLMARSLDIVFDFLCNYGQSILRPSIGLLFTFLSFAALAQLTSQYSHYKHGIEFNFPSKLGDSISLSASNLLPFLSYSRNVRINSLDSLFGSDPNFWIDLMVLSEGIIGFLFLFLIGLGMRNRFRI